MERKRVNGIELEGKMVSVDGNRITVYNSYFVPAVIKVSNYKIVVISTT